MKDRGAEPGIDGVTPARVRRTIRRRTGTTVLAAGVAFVALMVLLGPYSAAVPIPPPVVYRAPFSGTPILENDTDTEGCGNATLIHGASFNFAKGVAEGNVNATTSTANSCNSPIFNNTGVGGVIAGIASQQFVASAGSHTVKVTWNLTWSVSLDASRSGTAGYLQTETELEAIFQIYDVSTSTSSNPAEWESVNETNGSGSLSYHGHIVVTLSLKDIYTANEVYNVVTAIEVLAGAVASPSTSHAYASADLNVATGGNKAVLDKFTIS
jgi:hypothetical protein